MCSTSCLYNHYQVVCSSDRYYTRNWSSIVFNVADYTMPYQQCISGEISCLSLNSESKVQLAPAQPQAQLSSINPRIFLFSLFRPICPLGHRPLTIGRQHVRSCASSWFQLQPVWQSSASRSLLQVFLGLPLLRFPWGFQVRAWRVMLVGGFLRVCPIHLHLCFFISSFTSSCHVLYQRSLLLMVSSQKILSIFRRQPLTKVWTLLVIFLVVLQVSEPYYI